MNEYSERFSMSFIVLLSYIFCVLTIAFIGAVYQRYGLLHSSIIGGTLFAIGYGTTFTIIIKDWPEFKKWPIHEKVLCFIFGPWLFLAGGVYAQCDDEVELFIHRHNTKIMNGYLRELLKRKTEKRQAINARIYWPFWQSKGND